ncbi:MAG: hypothetical protein F6J87_08900 [Spirulina sp. SIO3F2]|nr:hypothetical protein [Spirulina sp. SIO3F2]
MVGFWVIQAEFGVKNCLDVWMSHVMSLMSVIRVQNERAIAIPKAVPFDPAIAQCQHEFIVGPCT